MAYSLIYSIQLMHFIKESKLRSSLAVISFREICPSIEADCSHFSKVVLAQKRHVKIVVLREY